MRPILKFACGHSQPTLATYESMKAAEPLRHERLWCERCRTAQLVVDIEEPKAVKP
jgi:hypothetical protein